jgi:hypothetical protein
MMGGNTVFPFQAGDRLLSIAESIFLQASTRFQYNLVELPESFPSGAAYLNLDAENFIGLRV